MGFLPYKKNRKVLFYPLSFCLFVCLFVCVFVCPEDFSGTARRDRTIGGMCIHDHHPLILQRDEGQGHKVKKTDFRRGGMLTRFLIDQKIYDIH